MSDRRPLNMQMVGQWIDIIRGMPLFQPEPKIRDWVESHKLPVPANHNRMAAAAGQTWEFSKFAVLADWVFEFPRPHRRGPVEAQQAAKHPGTTGSISAPSQARPR